jgi:hypothetical protein
LLIAAVYMRLDQGLCIKNGCPRHEQQAAVLAGLRRKKRKTGHINEGMVKFLINAILSISNCKKTFQNTYSLFAAGCSYCCG